MEYNTIIKRIKELVQSAELIGNPVALEEILVYSKNTTEVQGNWSSITKFIQKEFPSRIFFYDNVVTFSNGFVSFHISPIHRVNDIFVFRILIMENISESVISKVVGNSEKPTAEMIDFFNKRTKEHIDRVKKNLLRIGDWFDFDKKDLEERANSHDLSKYSDIEKEPYIWLTWYYKEKAEGRHFVYPYKIKDLIEEATLHHISVNPHHPEAHNSPSEMTNIDIAEMIADHAAMSQELSNSLIEWTRNNTMKKYEWKPNQNQLIWLLVRTAFPELA